MNVFRPFSGNNSMAIEVEGQILLLFRYRPTKIYPIMSSEFIEHTCLADTMEIRHPAGGMGGRCQERQ